jgi:hypothetical protein
MVLIVIGWEKVSLDVSDCISKVFNLGINCLTEYFVVTGRRW